MTARPGLALVGAAALCLTLAGCSSTSSSPASTASASNSAGGVASPAAPAPSGGASSGGASSAASSVPGPTTSLTVGTSPTISNASLYLGAIDGTFAKKGLVVTPKVIQSGAQAIPQLLNGQIQFAAADALGSMLAISHDTPIEIVVGGNVAPADQAKDPSGLIVKGDSPIKALSDLSGKTVGVNSLKSLAQVALQAAIDSKGGDSSTVKFVEIPFPQMVAAVQNGTVDAGATNEPFVTQAKAAGLTKVPFGGLATAVPGVPQVIYVTSKAYAKSHPEVVKAFADSVNAANVALGKDPALIIKVGAKSTTINAETLAKITLPTFGPELTIETLTKLETLMVKYGVLKAPLANLEQSVYSGSN